MVTGYFRRAYTSFTAHVVDIPPRLLAFFLALLLLAVPLTVTNLYALTVLTSACVMAIFAASWDLLVGRTGLMSLGHALFFGIGGYGTALLFQSYGLPLVVTLPLAVLIGTSLGVVVGFPCLRFRGPYLALVTMAFPVILNSLLYFFSDIFHGEFGIHGLPTFFPFLPEEQKIIAEYYLTVALMFISALILYKIANSHTGIVFVSILDDETASKACGINVTKYKLMSFAISGLFASLAGAVQAHLLTIANPPMFSLTLSFIPVVATFLGGIGTIYGPILGSFIYLFLDRYVLNVMIEIPYDWVYVKLLVFTLVVTILILKWPRGIGRFVTDKLQDLQEEREIEEIMAKKEKKKQK